MGGGAKWPWTLHYLSIHRISGYWGFGPPPTGLGLATPLDRLKFHVPQLSRTSSKILKYFLAAKNEKQFRRKLCHEISFLNN